MSDLQQQNALVEQISAIIGVANTITQTEKIEPYSKGFRFGSGSALLVARPATLLQMWQVLQACVNADVAIILQAANTGLTGGSTPDGDEYDRPVVIISTLLIDDIHLINDAEQIIGLPGSTLFGLEERLAPYGREPHSVIGSSCIGASIVGGVCNNSGGSLIHRGPSYTELALYAKREANGELVLVNNLGINLGDTPEQILTNLEQKNYTEQDIEHPDKLASDDEYEHYIRDVDSDKPARYNDDSRRLYETSGCAGKLAVFAVRLDTYPTDKKQVFYIGTNDADVLSTLRRHMLSEFKNLPISGDFLHRDCYAVSKKYGKDTFWVIDKLGSKFIPKLFSVKRAFDRYMDKVPFLPKKMSERVMQALSYLLPSHLPERMNDFHQKYQHHWILEMSGEGIQEARQYLYRFFKDHEGDYFECTEKEGEHASLHRFVAGGAIGRYHALHRHRVGPMVTIDVALRRNDKEWFETLPMEIDNQIEKKFYYGHLFCNVLHQNYVIKKGVDAKKLKRQILDLFDARGAEYPSEHNVGHEYAAKDTQRAFFKELDPTNTFNPGIGQTSKLKNWGE